MAWVTASKKKKLLNSEIFTSITALAAMMSRKTMIFKTRTAFRTTYPGPAKDSFRDAIMIEASVRYKGKKRHDNSTGSAEDSILKHATWVIWTAKYLVENGRNLVNKLLIE